MANLCKMSGKNHAIECFLWESKFLGLRHHHTNGWFPSMIELLKDESGLCVGNSGACICGTCDLSVRQALKSRDKGEPYQLRWLMGKRPLCVVFQPVTPLISRMKSMSLLER